MNVLAYHFSYIISDHSTDLVPCTCSHMLSGNSYDPAIYPKIANSRDVSFELSILNY